MRVLSVASEIFPLIKTGGLADVTAALPAALAGEAVGVRTVLPGYPAVLQQAQTFETAETFHDLFGGPARLLAGRAADLDLFVVDAPHLYRRTGGPYMDLAGIDWPDNAQRFAALSWVAAQIGLGLLPAFVPDIVHAHDWQGALTPAYLKLENGAPPSTVITIHNLAHQGVFPAHLMSELRLPASAFDIEGVEYYGQIGFLKAGIYFADRITTVSPSYVREILTEEGGMGLGGLLKSRASLLRGIVNGIDERVWDPATDPYVVATFHAGDLGRRAHNKAALQERVGLTRDPDCLLFGVISRLSWQKGLDLLLAALPVLLDRRAELVVLGTGDEELEDGYATAAATYRGKVGASIGYDEGLAHLIQAGSDALVIPSRFEPCGLTQLCALRYGAIPVVSRVGGLADTVVDVSPPTLATGEATGVQFFPVTRDMLVGAIMRTADLWCEKATWRQVQLSGMRTEVGWSGPAREYAALYRDLCPGK